MSDTTMQQALVTGTGRCGTGYVAQTLQNLGIDVTHEGRFTVAGPNEACTSAVDVSWMAVPWLKQQRGPMVHLVRHPLDVIASLNEMLTASGPAGVM